MKDTLGRFFGSLPRLPDHRRFHQVTLGLEITFLLVPTFLLLLKANLIWVVVGAFGGFFPGISGGGELVPALLFYGWILIPNLFFFNNVHWVIRAFKEPLALPRQTKLSRLALALSPALGIALLYVASVVMDGKTTYSSLLDGQGPSFLLAGISFLVSPLHLFWLANWSRPTPRSDR